MSTPDSSNPFATPDPEQVAQNKQAQHELQMQQAQQHQEAWAQYYAAQQAWAAQQQAAPQQSAQQPASQQWASQQWQGQNTGQPGANPQPAPYQPVGSPQQPNPYQQYPGPQYPAQGGYFHQTRPSTPTSATAALVLGIGSVFLLPLGIAALITGIIALRKIKATGSTGRGFALTGLITGAITTLISLISAVVLIALLTAMTPVSSDVSEPKTVPTSRAVAGNCLDVLPETEPGLKYSLVPCASPHIGQIIYKGFGVWDYPMAEAETLELLADCYQSSRARAQIEELGAENFELFLVVDVGELSDEAIVDEYHCIATPTAGKLQGSLQHPNVELVP